MSIQLYETSANSNTHFIRYMTPKKKVRYKVGDAHVLYIYFSNNNNFSKYYSTIPHNSVFSFLLLVHLCHAQIL